MILALMNVLTIAYGANYYVDNSAEGLNNGSSWHSAWKSFSDIDWSLIGPGDTLYISGGATSKTYNETLQINSSGNSDALITITKGNTFGHDGEVIIDGLNELDNAIDLVREDFVVIKNLSLINCIGDGTIHIDDTEGIIIENNSIHANGHGGVNIRESYRCIIINNFISTPAFSNGQTDGIYAQLNTENIYSNNYIVISNNNPLPHCDGIQAYQETASIYSNNYIEQDNYKESDAQGIYITSSYGVHKIFNNVIYCPNTGAHLIGFRNLTEGTGEVHVYNNTVIGKSPNLLKVSGSNPKIINNILKNTGNTYCIYFEDPINNYESIDYNVVFVMGDADPIRLEFNNEGVSWSEWLLLGAEAHGLNSDPKIDDLGRLQPDSPAIDIGLDLSEYFSTDKDGVIRPQGKWDIGAYEYRVDLMPTPPAPVNIRIK